MVPWEKPIKRQVGIVEPETGELRVDERVEQGCGAQGAGQHAGGAAVLQAEPLPAIGGEVAGLRPVGGDEARMRQIAGQHGCQADQVLAVGADAVQQDHELARRAAGARPEAGPAELGHVGSCLW